MFHIHNDYAKGQVPTSQITKPNDGLTISRDDPERAPQLFLQVSIHTGRRCYDYIHTGWYVRRTNPMYINYRCAVLKGMNPGWPEDHSPPRGRIHLRGLPLAQLQTFCRPARTIHFASEPSILRGHGVSITRVHRWGLASPTELGKYQTECEQRCSTTHYPSTCPTGMILTSEGRENQWQNCA